MGDSAPVSEPQKPGQYSFFKRLLSVIFGTDDEERIRKRQLKQIALELSRQKYKFYKPRSGQALPGLSKFLFEVYKIVGPAQTLVQGSENSKALKSILVDSFHTPDQDDALEKFSEDALREAAGSMTPDELRAMIKDAMRVYLGGFSADVVKQINQTYTLIQQLAAFAKFDYYFTLRKFDSSLLEGSFSKPPRSEAINAEYVSDDLKDFLEVLLPLDFDADWSTALEALSRYKSVEVVPAGDWRKLLNSLSAVVRSGVLVQIIRHVDKDPGYRPPVHAERHHIVESHLNILKTQVEASVQKLMREIRGQKIDQMAMKVFGTAFVQRLSHYNEKANAEFTRRMIAGYGLTQPMNYLAAFLFDYFNLDVRLLISEMFIVRAKWSDNSVSGQLSDAYSEVRAVAEALEEFNLALSEEGEFGAKLKKATSPTRESEASTNRKIRQIVHDIDTQAKNLIKDAAANLITVARIIKFLIQDYEQKGSEYIMNWRELDSFSSEPLRGQMVAVYKKIFDFIQLMQVFAKK